MTTGYIKPLPNVADPATAPFWRATYENQLVCQQCTRCLALRWTPRSVCPECLGFGSEWVEVRSTGSLYSWTTYYRAFDRRFADEIPYSVGLIELDDGPRMVGRLIGHPAGFAAGLSVRAVFQPVAPDTTLVHWALADSTERSVESFQGHRPADPSQASPNREGIQ